MTFKRATRSPFVIVGLIVVLVCILQVSRPANVEPGRSRLSVSGFFDQIEMLTYDVRQKLAAALNDPNHIAKNMGVLFFDDAAVGDVQNGAYAHFYAPAVDLESAQKLYPRVWPWPRFIQGQVVRELATEGAIAVGFDILFPELAEQRPEEFVKDRTLGALSSDEFFASQVRGARNVILGIQQEDTAPAQLFLTNATGLGSISSHSDYGVLRRVKPFHEIRIWHPIVRSLVKRLNLDLRRAEQKSDVVTIPNRATTENENVTFEIPLNPNGTMKLTRAGDIDFSNDLADNGPETEKAFVIMRIWNLGIALAAKALEVDLDRAEFYPGKIVLRGPNGLSRTIPLDGAGYFYINWSLRYEDIRNNRSPVYHGNLGEVLRQDKFRVSAGEAPEPKSGFKDRIVLIGSVASGNNMSDLGATPLNAQTPLVIKHLNVANSLLTDRYIRRGGALVDCLLVGLLGISAAGIAMKMRPAFASVTTLLLVVLYIAAASTAFVHFLYWAPIVLPAGCALTAAHACILIERTDALAVARRFFKHAGFRKVESVSPSQLLLHPKEGEPFGLVSRWNDGTDEPPSVDLTSAVEAVRRKHPGNLKLYLIYEGEGPGSKLVQRWRERLGCEIIPVLSAMLEKALAEQNYERQLRQLEEPYLIRADPYAEFKPIADPTWFYGREDLVRLLPTALAQGQHVGIFGLRKVGKTSLANQLRQRFVATPAVFLDCQGLPAKAESYFEAICQELYSTLKAQGIKRLPRLEKITDAEAFTRSILALFTRWQQAGQREPFILILDEIDKFFPNPEIRGREEILAEYVRVFRVLRGLAQSRQCLVVCVIAYRPVVNRQNVLTASVGENPMFNSFQEVFLGFLSAADSTALVREIGLWKNIVWEEGAAQRVFEFCGGHPLITRYFASHACKKGTVLKIDEGRVMETANELKKTLRKNEIGNYYKEAIWDLLSQEEQKLLVRIGREEAQGGFERDLAHELEGALSNLENFGLVRSLDGQLRLTADLFRVWLQRRENT